jgi:peptide subunit release factor 1 (eRF1)
MDEIVEHKAVPDSPVLSVYLDVDQTRTTNLKRHFEAPLKDMLRSIEAQLDEKQRKSFGADARRVNQFVSDFEPHGKGLIIFCDDSENFFRAREINVAVQNNAHWSETPYVLPLFEILDEYERYGVVLVDRTHARVFTVFVGEIEFHRDVLSPDAVRHIKTTGTDHIRSQKTIQDKSDTHLRWHLKLVAELLDRVVDYFGFDRLVLGGPVEASSELFNLLSKRVRTRVVRRIALPVEASERDILEATLKIEQEVERENEERIVDELIGGDGHRHVTLGLENTLLALAEGRLWRLVFARGLAPRGGQCTKCGMLFARPDGSCDYCDGAIEPVDDLIERIVERVVGAEGKVEGVAGNAAERLKQAGGIGAILRF